ncbi:ankyrin-3-like [Pollicipes pollicipes]|uniref:ankyrin-3-like n=1 Tax=Pollicipes pollicipes TaxID=41117 RepID=UPI0018857468|nr:ankyrin-3-like [Pollicipes pollicipes]
MADRGELWPSRPASGDSLVAEAARRETRRAAAGGWARRMAAGRSPGRRPAGDESDEELQEQASHRVRVLARRVLVQCQRSDWVAVEQSLKSLERAAQEGRLTDPLHKVLDEDGNIPLFLAADAGSLQLCKELLSYNAELQVQCRRRSGDTVLHMAVRRRDLELARLFVEHGVPVDAQNGEGQTALHVAAAEGDEAAVKYLYSLQANASVLDSLDRTPLHVAAEHGYTLVVEALADKFKASLLDRTKDGSTLLHIAACNGHTGAALAAIRKGVPLRMPNKAGQHALHTAAVAGHSGVISALIQSGETVDTPTVAGNTPLHLACEAGRPAVVAAILRHVADCGGGTSSLEILLDRRNCRGETVIHCAARQRQAQGQNGGDIVTLLCEPSLQQVLNVQTVSGHTCLMEAAQQGHQQIVKMLLDQGARVDLLDSEGRSALHQAADGLTPLHLAAAAGHLEACSALVQEGNTCAHVAALTGSVAVIRELLTFSAQMMGFTPVHLAAREGHSGVLEQLRALKVSMVATNVVWELLRHVPGYTPLHLACVSGQREVAAELLSRRLDQDSLTALHHASQGGHLPMVQLLVERGATSDWDNDDDTDAVINLAAAAKHANVVQYLMRQGFIKHALLSDSKFIGDLALMSARDEYRLLQDFILLSPVPVYSAVKLAHRLQQLSEQAVDPDQTELLDLLLQLRQKQPAKI